MDPACCSMVEDKRLELLLTYTVFHIGVYISLTTILVGGTIYKKVNHWLARISVGCFVLAGACGGAIAANIAEGRLTADQIFNQRVPLRVWWFDTWSLHTVATIEHAAFWAGLVPLALVFFFTKDGAGFKPAK